MGRWEGFREVVGGGLDDLSICIHSLIISLTMVVTVVRRNNLLPRRVCDCT